MNELLDQLPCAAVVTDGDGSILTLNSEFKRLLGLDVRNATTLDDVLPPAGLIFLQTHVWPLLRREGSVHELSLNLINPLGERVPVLVSARRGTLNDVVCYSWVFFVATERARFENDLLEARRRADSAATRSAAASDFVKTVTDAMPGLVAYWDRELRCRFANRSYLQWFGKAPDLLIGVRMQDVIGEKLFKLNEPYIRGVLGGEAQEFQRTIDKADGGVAQSLAKYIPHIVEDEVRGFFVLVTDVTSLKKAEAELQLAASVFRDTLDGIMIADDRGVIQSVNPSFSAITGYSANEAVGKPLSLLSSARNESGFASALAEQLVRDNRWQGESWGRRKDGSAFRQWQRVTTTEADGALRYVFVFNDITDRWHDQERSRRLALYDALTELPNRTLMHERLGQLIAATAREQRRIAVLFLDLDRFKQVNDSQGHEVGDEVLRATARRLHQLVRKTDTVARLGGDEFVILLDNPAGLEDVERIAGMAVAALNEPISCAGVAVQVGASIGIALHPIDGQTPAELLKSADSAMYEAKAAGKNTFRSSSSSLARAAERRTEQSH